MNGHHYDKVVTTDSLATVHDRIVVTDRVGLSSYSARSLPPRLASLNNKLKQTRQTGQEVTKAVREGEKLTKQAEDNFEMIVNVYRDLGED